MQAQDLDEMLVSSAPDYTFKIIELDVPSEAIVKRLSSRMICSDKSCQRPHTILDEQGEHKCESCGALLMRRHDDVPEVIQERFSVYPQGSQLIKDYLKKHNREIKVISADGKTPQQVFDEFKKLLK